MLHPWLRHHAGRQVFVERGLSTAPRARRVGHPEARRGATPRETERLGVVEFEDHQGH